MGFADDRRGDRFRLLTFLNKTRSQAFRSDPLSQFAAKNDYARRHLAVVDAVRQAGKWHRQGCRTGG
jgi:hypothetical protein